MGKKEDLSECGCWCQTSLSEIADLIGISLNFQLLRYFPPQQIGLRVLILVEILHWMPFQMQSIHI